MKKKIILWISVITLTISNNSFAQQKLTDFQVKISSPNEVFLSSDQRGNLACVFQSNKLFEVDFLDAQFGVTGTATMQKVKSDKSQKIIGAVLRDQFCYVYTFNKKMKTLSCYSFNKINGESAFSRVRILAPGEQFLRGFEMEGQFYFLTVPKHMNQLRMIRMNGREAEEVNYQIEMPTFYAALSRNNELLNVEAASEVGIEDIRYDMENNVKSTHPSKKLYHFNGRIYITFDEPHLTHLLTFDPFARTVEYKKLNFSLEKGNNSGSKQGNSFIHQNRFFRATLSPDQMNITILNLDSMNLITTYNFYPEHDIDILNGPIIQEGGIQGSATDERILKSSGQYFKRIQNGYLAIAANKIDSNRYEMEVGSYEVYSTGRNTGYSPPVSLGLGFGGLSVGTGGMGMGMGMGYPYGGYYPSYGFPGYYSYQPTTRINVTYFQSLLSKDDFEHVDGVIPPNVKNKVNDFERGVFKYNSPEVMRITPYKNNLLLGYYQKNGKRFNIIEFRR